MCGIAGIFNFDAREPVDEALLRTMALRIAHRGPDEDGFLVGRGIGLANVRLSIVGLADGRQPIANEDRTVFTVFNGEVYNYHDLRDELAGRGHQFRTHTDTEVVVHGYEEWGADFVDHLNAMFGIALWDAGAERLLLYRDRLGEKPLYYTVSRRRLIFCSEMKGLLAVPELSRELSPGAIFDALAFQYNSRAQTIFRAVRRLPPGGVLDVRRDGVQERTYWQVPAEPAAPRPEREWTAELRELLRDSVRRRMIADVPIGAFLSGGIDSSTVVALMREISGDAVRTFSVGFAVPGAFDESAHAATVAQHFGTAHETLMVRSMDVERLLADTVYSLDEPIADYAAIPTFLLCQFARRHVKVVLTGEGADELFAGYSHYRLPRMLGTYQQVPLAIRRLLATIGGRIAPGPLGKALTAGALSPVAGYELVKAVFPDAELESVLSPDFLATLDGERSRPELARLFARSDAREALDRYLMADLSTWLPEDLLMKVDKMSMSVSLEARVPFLDHRIVELVAGMSASLKWRGGPKYILKQAVADLVPANVLSRPKHGFTLPISRWLRHDLRALADELLLGERTRARGILAPRVVEELWRRYLAGNEALALRCWVLLNFEMWCRLVLDGNGAPREATWSVSPT